MALSALLASQQIIRWYGWKPDKGDPRDRTFDLRARAVRLPTSATLKMEALPPVWDQGALGSCTGFSTAGCAAFLRACKGETPFVPSARFIYYNARVIEATVADDAGAEIRDAVKAVVKSGVCNSYWCPYDIKKFAVKPRPWAYVRALWDTVMSYERIYDNERLNAVKTAIVENIPVVFGFSVFLSFESEEMTKTGLMRVPPHGTGDYLVGGHAVWLLGYDDNKVVWDQMGACLIRNSWNTDWGINGDFWMPYSVLAHPQLCGDFWALRSIR